MLGLSCLSREFRVVMPEELFILSYILTKGFSSEWFRI